MIDPSSQCQVASDGYRIHVTAWKVPEGTPLRGRVVAVHGIQSHGGWYHHLGRSLAEAGYETYFPDRRGSGRNQVDRGHVNRPSRLIKDQVEFLASVKAQSPAAPVALLGISWGAKIVLTVAGRRPDLVDGIGLLCPGLCPSVDVSGRDKLRIGLAFLFRRHKTFPIPLNDPALFTATESGRAFIAGDPLALRVATAGLLASSAILDRMVSRASKKVQAPTLLMLGSEDRIIDNAKTRTYFDRIPAASRRIVEYPGAHHTLEFEPDPSLYARDLISWLDEALPKSE